MLAAVHPTASDVKLRAWWSHRQGLDGSFTNFPPASILERTGWARSVGGVGPYLTLFSRGGVGREAADAAAARLEIHELPSARSCTYVLPASEFALGLKVGQGFGHESEMKVARKIGVTDREIDKLCDAIVAALAKQSVDPARLRDQTDGLSRNLGAEGKKKGLTTTMPLALGKLQSLGEIRRIPVNGRLDQHRYRYALWRPNPLNNFKLSREEAYAQLACRFFGWIGPATIAEFQSFSGLGATASKAAIEGIKLVAPADGDDRLMLAKDRDEFEDFKVPAAPRYNLTSSLDSAALLHCDLKALLAPDDLKRLVPGEKGMIAAGGLSYLPAHAILDRGRLVGLWEFDHARQSIVWMSFGAHDKSLSKTISEMQDFIRTQLGDARSFSLDSPESRIPRIEALRRAASGSTRNRSSTALARQGPAFVRT